jgi:hypothetical protein
MSRSESNTATCITCGDYLHPERARKYGYCMKPECQARNLKGLTMVAVGVNKSAAQQVLLGRLVDSHGHHGQALEVPGLALRLHAVVVFSGPLGMQVIPAGDARGWVRFRSGHPLSKTAGAGVMFRAGR